MELDNSLQDNNIDIEFIEDEDNFENNHNTYAEFNKKEKSCIKFLSYENGQYIINPEYLEFLRSIEEELIIVIFTGKSMTGKSHLLNLLLNNNNTKGVFI